MTEGCRYLKSALEISSVSQSNQSALAIPVLKANGTTQLKTLSKPNCSKIRLSKHISDFYGTDISRLGLKQFWVLHLRQTHVDRYNGKTRPVQIRSHLT